MLQDDRETVLGVVVVVVVDWRDNAHVMLLVLSTYHYYLFYYNYYFCYYYTTIVDAKCAKVFAPQVLCLVADDRVFLCFGSSR